MTEHGFANPPLDASGAFRSIMGAMSRPGRITSFHPPIAAPEPLWPTAAALAVTLCDFQTPIWLAPTLRTPEVSHYLRFHTGAPLTENLADAAYAFADARLELPPPAAFAQGTHEYPDRSATLVIQVEAMSAKGDAELTGPGIPGSQPFGALGLDERYWALLADNHAAFPIGIDIVFVSPDAIAALPRSTAIRILENS